MELAGEVAVARQIPVLIAKKMSPSAGTARVTRNRSSALASVAELDAARAMVSPVGSIRSDRDRTSRAVQRKRARKLPTGLVSLDLHHAAVNTAWP